MSDLTPRGRLPLHLFIAIYLLLQLLLPLRGLLLDKHATRGDFSWNMYSDHYTCSIAYSVHEADGNRRRLEFERFFRDEASSTKILHRDRLPAFHVWLCDEVIPHDARLDGLVSCSLNGEGWADLVDPAANLCVAADHGVRR